MACLFTWLYNRILYNSFTWNYISMLLQNSTQTRPHHLIYHTHKTANICITEDNFTQCLLSICSVYCRCSLQF